MKKVLITGKNSYIGTAVGRWLSKESGRIEVYILDLKDISWREHNLSIYDVVFHVAGLAHIKETKKNKDLYFSINRDLAVDVAKNAKEAGVKQFIFMSTMAVFGKDSSLKTSSVINEFTELNPKSSYALSKLEAEKNILALKSDDFLVTILRPPMVYGENSKGNYALLAKAASILPIFPLIENERSAIHIDVLSQFVLDCIENKSVGVYHPEDENYINTSSLFAKIASEKGKTVYLSSFLGKLIILFGCKSKTIAKVFGNLTYDFRGDNIGTD